MGAARTSHTSTRWPPRGLRVIRSGTADQSPSTAWHCSADQRKHNKDRAPSRNSYELSTHGQCSSSRSGTWPVRVLAPLCHESDGGMAVDMLLPRQTSCPAACHHLRSTKMPINGDRPAPEVGAPLHAVGRIEPRPADTTTRAAAVRNDSTSRRTRTRRAASDALTRRRRPTNRSVTPPRGSANHYDGSGLPHPCIPGLQQSCDVSGGCWHGAVLGVHRLPSISEPTVGCDAANR